MRSSEVVLQTAPLLLVNSSWLRQFSIPGPLADIKLVLVPDGKTFELSQASAYLFTHTSYVTVGTVGDVNGTGAVASCCGSVLVCGDIW